MSSLCCDAVLEAVQTTIFKGFEVEELLTVAMVSTDWRRMSESSNLWQDACGRAWAGKQGMQPPPRLFPWTRFSGAVARTLTGAEMRAILAARRVRTDTFLERQEYIDAFGSSGDGVASRARRPAAGVCRSDQSTPDLPKWKASYFAAQADSTRRAITMEELVGSTWTFVFKHPEMQAWLTAQKIEFVCANFNEDFSYKSDLDWIRGHDEGLSWYFSGPNGVRVGDYPELQPARTSDWGWTLENEYVLFSTLGERNDI